MDATQFDAVYRESRGFVVGWLRKSGLKDRAAADIDDAVQEVYHRLWTGRERYTPHPEKGLFPLLKRISFSVAVDFHRRGIAKDAHTLLGDVPAVGADPADHTEAIAAAVLLNQLLMHLTPQHRAVLWLRHVSNVSVDATARLMGLTVPQVYDLTRMALIAARKTALRYHFQEKNAWMGTDPMTTATSTRWTRSTVA